jgi:hypothetical protein
MRSDRTLLRWYKTINKRFFDGACPERVCVRWIEPENDTQYKWETTYFGEASHLTDDSYHDYLIIMSRINNKKWTTRISTLVHEMVHLATDLKDDHGPAFEQWRQHVADRGIFRKHALRKDYTLF